MILKITKSKIAQSLYGIKSIYRNHVCTSKIVEKLGTYANLQQNLTDNTPANGQKNRLKN